MFDNERSENVVTHEYNEVSNQIPKSNFLNSLEKNREFYDWITPPTSWILDIISVVTNLEEEKKTPSISSEIKQTT